ncbi:MAG: DEAD/DEAH box helicase [Deltaproteobacteria bacterium]|nr:DEAD/DEAH box helicase [Deltaproteobacteria bacterium]
MLLWTNMSALDRFQPVTRAWFESAFAAPTPAQSGAWEAIAAGDHALVVAPTGSGKTLAAFLWGLDRLVAAPPATPGVRVLYVSPLKALAVDVERNLRAPLAGMRGAAQQLGLPPPAIEVAVRSGDTAAAERRRLAGAPPDILITTPESLYLLLTSGARSALATVETVIVDEVHALAGGKRGAHLALSLERLDARLPRPAQRIGLSATVRPMDEVARFLGGVQPVTVVDARAPKELDVSVVVPVDDMTALAVPTAAEQIPSGSASGAAPPPPSIWPHVEEAVLALIRAHRSTIVFANSRRLAERLCASLNELAGEELVRAHHGSVSREQRALIEDALKTGRLQAVVATSSLELGIDMGAVDLVIQIEAPDSVASGLQRIGRAGHQVGARSRGIVFPKYRGDLLEAALVSERMQVGAIEALRVPRNPLDVLAQQIVAMVAMDDWTVADLAALVRRAAPFAELPDSALAAVLDMLAGRYPSDAFAGLRARLTWDRVGDRLTARQGARLVAVTSGGTIPDRGLFGVYLVGERGPRVGELDEEMVYESRAGDVFTLGATSWRIEDITADRVLVSPAPGTPGKMPFWRGDALGRPPELGRALGAWVRELAALPDAERRTRLMDGAGCDARAAANLSRYLDEQRAATGVLPDDRTLVVERFRDALGDWRLCIHSFFGARLHAAWAQAIRARLRQQLGLEVQVIHGDNGLVIRVPEGDELPSAEAAFLDPEEVEDLVVAEVGGSALFASRFRECAGRALLLPRRRPGQRTPLWQLRQRAASLLQVASQFPSFPIVLETYRECLRDVFDLPELLRLLAEVRSRVVRVVEVETDLPSPFAAALQLSYVSAFMYEGDAPLAERRAQALALDRAVLAELMGREELRDLLDADALVELEHELQRLLPERKAGSLDALHELLRDLGDLTAGDVAARLGDASRAEAWLTERERARRALRVRVAGEARWIAVEDAARYRDGLGVALPLGVPAAFLEPLPDPLGDLIRRFARTRGPFAIGAAAERFGLGAAVVLGVLRGLEQQGKVVEGEFRPGASGREWVDAEVLRRLRRRSLAALRREVEPAPPEALARFTVAWHEAAPSGPRLAGLDALWRVVEQLQGVPLPASALEQQILRARIPDYSPLLFDQLGASGELVWAGAGGLGANDGWIVLAQADLAPLLLPPPLDSELTALAQLALAALGRAGALFFRQLADALGGPNEQELVLALWELVWAGHVTNDTLAPLRAVLSRKPLRPAPAASAAGRRPKHLTRLGPPAGAGRWSLAPGREPDATRRRHALAEQALRRHGIVTRAAVAADRLPGGFAAVYPLLVAMEERGRVRRGYFVDGLGGAQFALPGAVDRMRALGDRRNEDAPGEAVVLAATDPANPYGAALPWPERGAAEVGHRAGRKAGACVVLVDGGLALYVERGGKSLLSYGDDAAVLQAAVAGLAAAARARRLGRIEIERADGEPVRDTPLAAALEAAGFSRTYKGLRLRA